MPRIRTENKIRHELFNDMERQRAEVGERGDCAVKAVAALCDVPYKDALDWMNSNGRQPKRGTPWIVIFAAITHFGKQHVQVDPMSFVRRYPSPYCVECKNVTSHHPKRFSKVWKDGRRYLFATNGHVLAVINGENIDWTKGRSFRARNIYEII